jgi:hypothetical protein
MENTLTAAAAMSSSPLMNILTNPNIPIVRKVLLRMLRPMDFVSLVRATNFYILLTHQDQPIYTRWWRQIFCNMRWASRNTHTTIIGKDLIRLISALHRWEYFDASEIKLLVVVREKSSSPTIREGEVDDEARKGLKGSIDTSYMWAVNEYAIPERQVQMCVLFLTEPSLAYVDLYFLWSQALLEPIQAMQPLLPGSLVYPNPDRTFSPLRQIQLPIGAMRGTERAIHLQRDQWFRAWFTKAPLSNSSTNETITRPDVQVDSRPPTEFRTRCIVRLLVQQDGSLLIPTMPSAARVSWFMFLALQPTFVEW